MVKTQENLNKEDTMHIDPKEKALREQVKKEGINTDLIDDSYGDVYEDGVDEYHDYTNDNTSEYGDDSYEY